VDMNHLYPMRMYILMVVLIINQVHYVIALLSFEYLSYSLI
jgi:hypothetical protein